MKLGSFWGASPRPLPWVSNSSYECRPWARDTNRRAVSKCAISAVPPLAQR